MKFKIVIQRIEHREHTFEVEAASSAAAQNLAFEISANHDFNQNQVHYATEELVSIEVLNNKRGI